jgi:multicomponent Na+:H+ antiporter subunit C
VSPTLAGPATQAAGAATVLNATSTVVVAGLFAVGTYLLLQRGLMRVVMGLVLLGHATNLLLLLVGGRSGRPAMVGTTPTNQMSDPLPQGMALTSIVITFALTTFLLAVAYRAWTLLGNAEVRDDVEDHRLHVIEERLEALYHFPHLLPRPHHPPPEPGGAARPPGGTS